MAETDPKTAESVPEDALQIDQLDDVAGGKAVEPEHAESAEKLA